METPDCILNITSRMAPSTKWEGKNTEEIINELMAFMCNIQEPTVDELLPYFKLSKFRPVWSLVDIPDEKEMARLDNLRRNIEQIYNYPNPPEPLFFAGYIETPRGKGERWYMPCSKSILEFVSRSVDWWLEVGNDESCS